MFRTKRKAFTVVEVIIAAAVLSMVFTVLWKVYRGVTDSFKRSSWTLKTQSSTRNALTYLREEMQRASYWSRVTASNVEIKDGPEYQFRTNAPNQPDFQEHSGSAGIIAQWVICRPAKTVGAVEPGFEINCVLKYQDKKLLYSRTPVGTAPPNEVTLSDKTVLDNVEKLGVRVQDEDPGSTSVSRLFVFKVWVKHPDTVHFPNLVVEEQTAAKIDIKSTTL